MSIDLDAIEARLAAATPGPWKVAEVEGWIGIDPVCPPHGTDDAAEISGGLADLTAADADLIAHAPTDLAALVAEVRTLREALDIYVALHNELRSTLAVCADRMDEFTYQEFDGALDDGALDRFGEQYTAKIAVAEAENEHLRAVAEHAANVMAKLDQWGPSIVPHLLDTDDNEGQYLRAALDAWRGGEG